MAAAAAATAGLRLPHKESCRGRGALVSMREKRGDETNNTHTTKKGRCRYIRTRIATLRAPQNIDATNRTAAGSEGQPTTLTAAGRCSIGLRRRGIPVSVLFSGEVPKNPPACLAAPRRPSFRCPGNPPAQTTITRQEQIEPIPRHPLSYRPLSPPPPPARTSLLCKTMTIAKLPFPPPFVPPRFTKS